ncbi:CDP-diacylglycerol-glycerol-3-phosphate 3-phosphatidyltransferase, mitochondrial [Smittium culicis]|uniref:CDP-diacylglycerol--glycerol-3-phosphate 3-phosphatidyltransferase n=1 Tax=Smittium culicis TaxID=133412 RepID=A0A1R1XPF3_9FUNG|nr:CDP-diacylglycerol-glycerol-3-phosphate 3-phosphatidyltransferase, mitochondrial [Smittium culicis]
MAFRNFAHNVMSSFIDSWSNNSVEKSKLFFSNDIESINVSKDEKPGKINGVSMDKNKLDGCDDTILIPTIQMNPLFIDDDERFMKTLFGIINTLSNDKSPCRTDIASAYFNFANLHKNSILNSKGIFNLVVASPKSNGFYGAKGISGHIPNAYSMFELEFMNLVEKKNRSEKIKLFEFYRQDWTYHAKGILFLLNKILL